MTALRYSWEHLTLRAAGRTVPLEFAATTLPADRLRHANTLPRGAFDLPDDRFAAPANLIDVVAAALVTITGERQNVISPVGSVVYARRGSDLLWDLVHDTDVWCYVPAAALRGQSLHRWHRVLQVEVFRELRRRGVRAELTRPNRYVNTVDRDGRRRMVELKLAHQEWLVAGLACVHRRFCGVRARRGRAYSLRPRLEWAAYSPFENHYPSSAAAAPFAERVGSIPPGIAMRGMRFMYHENLAAAMRQFGPAHVAESQVSTARLLRARHGVLKKLLVLSVIRRDQQRRGAILEQLLHPPRIHGAAERRREVRRIVAQLNGFRSVDAAVLAQWLPTDPLDLREVGLPLQSRQLGEEPARGEQRGRGALLDDPAL